MTQAKLHFATIEEYLNYDYGSDARYELVDGELIEMPPESRLNLQIASFLFATFLRLGIPSRLLTIGVQVVVIRQKVTARQPDLVVLSEECATALKGAKSALITLDMPPPTLVIEMVSPGKPGTDNYNRDYIEKPKEYALRGIPEYWVIDPSRNTVLVLSLDGQDYREIGLFQGQDRISSPTFPALQLTAEQILTAGE